jgi:hypothetical protein
MDRGAAEPISDAGHQAEPHPPAGPSPVPAEFADTSAEFGDAPAESGNVTANFGDAPAEFGDAPADFADGAAGDAPGDRAPHVDSPRLGGSSLLDLDEYDDADDFGPESRRPRRRHPVTADERRRGRRAVWISLGAIAVVVAGALLAIGFALRPTPGHVHTPTNVAGFSRDDQSNAKSTADYLQTAIAAGLNLDSSVGAVYANGTGDAHSVIFAGGTTSSGSDSARLSALIGMLDDGTDGVANVTHEPAGQLGGQVECALTTDSNVADASSPQPMAVCGWADRDTVGLALFPNRSIADASNLFRQMRPALEDH